MKYIEKAMELRPDLTKKEILKMCPTDFKLMRGKCETFADYCDDCWNRQVPKKYLEISR